MKTRVQVMGMVSPNWVYHETGVKFDQAYFMDPEHRHRQNQKVAQWLRDFNANLHERFQHYDVDWQPVGISGIGGVFDNRSVEVVTVGLPQTFVLVTAMYGGEIVYFDADNPDVRGYPLEGVQHPDEIHLPEVESTWPVCEYLQQYDEMADRYGRENVELFVDVDAKTGMPMWYLHSPLTIAYRLRGDRLFSDMVENPPLAHRILDAALQTSWDLFLLYERKVGKKVRFLPLAACIASLISPKVYRAWELPRIQKLIEHYGPTRIHSCGPSTHILKLLAELPGIAEMEIGAGTDIALTRRLFPQATINYLIDTPKFVQATAEETRREVVQVIEQNEGGPLVILWPAETGTPMDTIEAVYATVSEHNWPD